MARAADLEPSGMAALIGVDSDQAADVAAKRQAGGGHLQVANLNAPGQVVVAGSEEDIEWVVDNARDLGVRRAIPLKVAGAFHSSFMAPAGEEVGAALQTVEFTEPAFPVWSNTTARPHVTADLAVTLRDQVVSTVRFEESLTAMAGSGIDTFVHVGPGDVTAGMAKRTVDGASVHVVSGVADIPGVTDALGTVT
jgi:[acyl-carrier-protein] S-malonyltransferase